MRFKFTAKDIEGKTVTGYVSAIDQETAKKMLIEKDMEALSLIDEEKAAKEDELAKALNLEKYTSMFDRVSLKDVVDFSKQMAALMEAGVSVAKALQMLSEGASGKPLLKSTLDRIVKDVKTGESISGAFSKHKKIFSDFYVNLVKTGEESGKMSQSFSYLSDYLDRNYALIVKVRNAMIYPGFVITIFFVVMILIFTLVIPKLAEILKSGDVELPMLTQVVLSISNFLVNYGVYLFFALFLGVFYAYFQIQNSKDANEFLDTFKLRFPLIKNVYKMLFVTRIADNIQTLLTSGVSFTKSIQITGEVVGNIHYKKIMDQALMDLKGGVPFSKSLSRHPDLIPDTLVQMLKIGEETGETGKLMGNIAKFYQREINTTIDTMVGLIEPIMIVALGAGVGLLLVSVLMPIYNLAGSF